MLTFANSTIISLWYFSSAWDKHSLPSMFFTYTESTHRLIFCPAGRPQISAVLLLLLSSACCYVVSHLMKTSTSIEALFNIHRRRSKSVSVLHADDDSLRNGLEETRPNRPGRWGIVVLVWAISTRIQVFLFLQTRQQCSSFGYEVCDPASSSLGTNLN